MAVSGIGNVLNAIGITDTARAPVVAGPDAPAGGTGNVFTKMLDGVQAAQSEADDLAIAAATGNLQDIHTYTIAATEAQLVTELTVAVRNRAVESFNEIMRMQV
jgi:flagellar hook-basal body complex protein FliE